MDLKQASTTLLSDFRNSALERLLLGIVAILLVLSLGLRSVTAALRVTLPILLAIGLTSTLLGAMGERLSLFHLIALLLSAGIGIDYSLFFHRCDARGTERLNILHALLVCAVSTVTVLRSSSGRSEQTPEDSCGGSMGSTPVATYTELPRRRASRSSAVSSRTK